MSTPASPQVWLQHAEETLDVAGRALWAPALTRCAVEEAKIAAEMALKSYLVSLGVTCGEPGHDLLELAHQAVTLGDQTPPREALVRLNRSVKEDSFLPAASPSLEEAQSAVASAEEVVSWVRQVLA